MGVKSEIRCAKSYFSWCEKKKIFCLKVRCDNLKNSAWDRAKHVKKWRKTRGSRFQLCFAVSTFHHSIKFKQKSNFPPKIQPLRETTIPFGEGWNERERGGGRQMSERHLPLLLWIFSLSSARAILFFLVRSSVALAVGAQERSFARTSLTSTCNNNKNNNSAPTPPPRRRFVCFAGVGLCFGILLGVTCELYKFENNKVV